MAGMTPSSSKVDRERSRFWIDARHATIAQDVLACSLTVATPAAVATLLA